jgi:hypothetical protein
MGARCRNYESRRFEGPALEVVREIAKYNPTNALDALEVTADQRFDAAAAASCRAIVGKSTFQGRLCLQVIRGKTPSPELSRIVTRIAERRPDHAIEAFRVGGTASIAPALGEICLDVAARNSYLALDCVQAVKNKTLAPGAERNCLPPRTPGTVSMIECLKNLSPTDDCPPGEARTPALAPLEETARQLRGRGYN